MRAHGGAGRRASGRGVVMVVLALLLAVAPVPGHAAVRVTASTAGAKLVGQSTYAWGTVTGGANAPVWIDVQVSGRWSRSQSGKADAKGAYKLPITYGSGTAGSNLFRVGATVGGKTYYSSQFRFHRVKLSTAAAGMKRVGEAANAWGTAAGAAGGSAWTEFQVAGKWSRSQTATIDKAGKFTIPLTYGKDKTGAQRFRVGVKINNGTVYAAPLTQYRIRLTASGAPSKYVGETTYAWGKAEGAPGATIVTQFKIAGAWKDSQRVKASSDGSYTIPLTYGKDKAGTYAWRIAVIHNGATLYFGEHRLIRTKLAVRIAVIGDSYSAGNGTIREGNYDGPAGSYRSRLAYGPRFADMLRATGNYTVQLDNPAWSGAQIDHTDHGILTQAATISPATKLVLVTAGGNDAGFGSVVEAHLLNYWNPFGHIRFNSAAAQAEQAISQLGPKYAQLFAAIEKRLGPNSNRRIVLLGYPKLYVPSKVDNAIKINQLQEQLENQQLQAARRWNATHRLKVTFIPVDGADGQDYRAGIYRGHELVPNRPLDNPVRWINHSLETAGQMVAGASKIDPVFSSDKHEWYHPNITGHYETGRHLLRRLRPTPSGLTVYSASSTDEDLTTPLQLDGEVQADDLELDAWVEGDEVAKLGMQQTFDASGTIAGGHDIVTYRWDFESDGIVDLESNVPVVSYTYPALFDGRLTLEVEDDAGRTSTATLPVTVSRDGDRIPDELDNCPLVANTGQQDYDQDGLGDLCDPTPGDPLLEDQ